MKKRREIQLFSISFLDLLSGALGAVIILYIAVPKGKVTEVPTDDPVKEMMQKDLVEANTKWLKAQEEIKELKDKLIIAQATKAEEERKEEPKPASGADLDIGFKFKGKSIVFLIDTSYSMVDEDRMGQVKAGLKMLLTAMPSTYKIEVVQFPFGSRAPFRAMWGTTKQTTGYNKLDAFDFIYRLSPNGGTPTRDVLLYALRNYPDMTDLVLLSDGAPSYHNSNKKDDIYDIMNMVRQENTRKVQINTIGVGAKFIQDKTSTQYQFMSLLAEQSGGFFVGF